MTTSAIVPKRPGEKPTESGWYVSRWSDVTRREPFIVYVRVDDDPIDPDEPMVEFVGDDCPRPLASQNLKIIARIYPERIEGEASAPAPASNQDAFTRKRLNLVLPSCDGPLDMARDDTPCEINFLHDEVTRAFSHCIVKVSGGASARSLLVTQLGHQGTLTFEGKAISVIVRSVELISETGARIVYDPVSERIEGKTEE